MSATLSVACDVSVTSGDGKFFARNSASSAPSRLEKPMLTSKVSAIVVVMPRTLVFTVFPPNNIFPIGDKHNAKRGRDSIETGVFEVQCFSIANGGHRANSAS